MSNRVIYQALSDLARRVETLHNGTGSDTLTDVEKQIKRLAREVYKANALYEAQAEQTRQAVEQAEIAIKQLDAIREQAVRDARLDVIKALLPVLDSINAAIKSGAAQFKPLYKTSPQAAKMLAAWLKGQHLLQERLIKLLEAEGVQAIPTIGTHFDPYKHVATKAAHDPSKPDNTILVEEQRGYMKNDIILRYAEVVVNRHIKEHS